MVVLRIKNLRRQREHSCRTCCWWAKPSGERAHKDAAYLCKAPLPDMTLPDSVTLHWSYKRIFGERKPMTRDEGTTCPVWAYTYPSKPG